jgi:hypothetical protein
VDASLAFAAELEQRDAALAARIAHLGELGRRVDEIRAKAEQLGRFLERLPLDRKQLETALADAERDREAARTALDEARRAVKRARGESAAATARRHEAHAASDVRTTEDRRGRLVARREELEREADAAAAGSQSLAAHSRELAAELEAAPRVAGPEPPASGLDALADWGSRAHAAVFGARSGLETERERVVREANELAASVLGEPLYTTSVAVVRERLEERLA